MLIALVGNNCEVKEREVEATEGEKFAKGLRLFFSDYRLVEHNFLFFETSAKTGENIDNVCLRLIIFIYFVVF
jgi:hypothetical protein